MNEDEMDAATYMQLLFQLRAQSERETDLRDKAAIDVQFRKVEPKQQLEQIEDRSQADG